MSQQGPSTWLKYKETMSSEKNAHDYARSGDVSAMAALNLSSAQLEAKNEKGHTPLMLAAYHGHLGLVEYLLNRGADANSLDAGGNSILMGVAFKGHVDVATLLLSRGAQVDYANPKQQTALDFAQMFGRTDVIKLIQKFQNKPQKFGFLDFIRSWLSFLFSILSPGGARL